MAAPWARWFYRSKGWRACRAAFLDSKHWLCERCHAPAVIAHHKVWLTRKNITDPGITLGWWNLEALCKDCHNKEHHRVVSGTREGFAFDEDGNLVEA